MAPLPLAAAVLALIRIMVAEGNPPSSIVVRQGSCELCISGVSLSQDWYLDRSLSLGQKARTIAEPMVLLFPELCQYACYIPRPSR